MNVNNFRINFDKFDDLHLNNYKSILNKKNLDKEFYDLLKNIEKIKILILSMNLGIITYNKKA